VEQKYFEWADPIDRADRVEVVLDRETTKLVIELMARALIAVVRAAEEADDDR
jgi:hypothetical protein